MQLTIEGRAVSVKPGQTIRDMVCEMNLDAPSLSQRPIAAKIAGEVFTLNYIPLRLKDAGPDRLSIRRAVAASDGIVRLLHYSDAAGKDVYTRSACFAAFLALRILWPESTARISCSMGNSVYISVENAAFDVAALKEKMQSLVCEDFPFIRRRVSIEDAKRQFAAQGQHDKAALLAWRTADYYDEYFYGDFSDYYYGEMLPSSGYLTVWDILPAQNGFILSYPDDLNPDVPSRFESMPNFFRVFAEGERWCELMECETAANLNCLTQSGKIRELIRVNEALHEKRFSQIADEICDRDAQVVMLAGPSSSGKTTSANRLATQLRVHGKAPILISLDNYYRNRCDIAPGPDGTVDLEHIDAIDTPQFCADIEALLLGKTVSLPAFNFKTGCRDGSIGEVTLKKNSVIIVEGIHGLNPVLIPADADKSKIFRLYVSPLLPLNLDDHNRIPTSYLRLLRRIVRDYETRGASVQRTIAMWDSVRSGEKRWIFPYQENADVIFNSSTLYELAVLKKHIYPLLEAIGPEEACYDDVRTIVKILNYILQAEVDDEIPPTSIVREFIGGNTFYRE